MDVDNKLCQAPLSAVCAKPMTSQRWQELKQLFEKALGMPADSRAHLVNEVSSSDPDLGDQLRVFLEGDDQRTRSAPFLRRAILESRENQLEAADHDFEQAASLYGLNLEGQAELNYQRGYIASTHGQLSKARDLIRKSLQQSAGDSQRTTGGTGPGAVGRYRLWRRQRQ
jgi:tetratricopeptide (TPR) repeat protein